MKAIVPIEMIEKKIYLIRGQKVMLDSDLAGLYGVTTKVFNQGIKRNRDRFPEDFMFQLTDSEANAMRSQIVTASNPNVIRSQNATASKRNIRYLPYAFTEHGVIMAASVLNSQRAVDVSVYVVRTFVRLRQMLAMNKELAHKLAELERKVESHDGSIRRDFMFQLDAEEHETLRSQFVTLKAGRGAYRKYHPYAFTEQGVAMLTGG